MASQEQQLAGEIVRAALKRPVHERAAYLAASCAGNDALRQEVEVLLRYNQQAEDPLPRGKTATLNPNGIKAKRDSHPLTQISQILRASEQQQASAPEPPKSEPPRSESKKSEPPSAEAAVNPALDFGAPTIRVNESELGALSDALANVLADPVIDADASTVQLDWLSRLTDDNNPDPLATTIGPSPFAVNAPAQTEVLADPLAPPPVSPPRLEQTEVLAPVAGAQSDNAKAKTGGFENLFKRVTMPPQTAAQESKGATLSAVKTEADSPYQTEFVPPPVPDPPPVESREETLRRAAASPIGTDNLSDLNASAAFTTGAKTLDGRMLGPYQLLYEIGRGGMGRVYLAEDTRLGRRVALKMLLRSSTRSPERVRRFEQEARAASSLNHPNILTIHEIGEIKGVHYLATEFVEGFTLRQVIEHKRLTLTKILDVAVQVADALATAHDANIVHRDIKPENLMMRLDGYVKVLDFGIAKLLENNTAGQPGNPLAPTTEAFDTQPGMIIGTSDYMSPEQARGLRVDKRTDIFSLGIVLYEMVTGVRPFTGATPTDVVAALLTREPIPITQRLSGAPEGLHRILKRALSKDRENRYPSARELSNELKALRQDLEISNRVVAKTGQIPGHAPGRPAPIPPDRPTANGRQSYDTRTTNRMGGAQQSPAPPAPAQRPSGKVPPAVAPQENPAAGAIPASARLGTRPKPATVDLPPPPPPNVKPIVVDEVVQVASRPIPKAKVGFGPMFLLTLALLGLAGGIWWNYFRTPSVIGLAIMPFNATRLSGNTAPVANDDEEALRLALAEGLHESLIQRLAPLPKLRVLARNSVRNVRKGLDVRETGKLLNVSHVMTGRIVTRGSSVTVSFEVYDTKKGEMLWSQRYERTLADIHTLPENMSTAVAKFLALELAPPQQKRLASADTANNEAYQNYLKGRYMWLQRQPDTVKASLSYLQRAVELDSSFARAHVALAESYALAPLLGVMTVEDAVKPSRAELSQAMKLDPQLAEAFYVYGFVLHQFDWKFVPAEKALKRALELNPNLAVAQLEFSSLLNSLGRFDEARQAANAALELDPLATMSRLNLAVVNYYGGQMQEAADHSLDVSTLNPKMPASYKYQGLAYWQLGRVPDALDTLQKGLAQAPADTELKAALASVLAASGNAAEARKILDELRALPESQSLPQYRLATIYTALDEKESALVALTQSVAAREPGVVWLKVDPQLNALREDQRFKELVKQVGLP